MHATMKIMLTVARRRELTGMEKRKEIYAGLKGIAREVCSGWEKGDGED